MRALCVSFVLCLVLSACPAAAGWRIVEKSHGRTSTFYIQDQVVKDVSAATRTMVDLKKGRIYFYQPQKRIFWQGTPAAFRAAMEKAAERREAAMLAAAPPERRKALAREIKRRRRLLARPQKYRVRVVDQGAGGVIAGYKTRRYQVYVDGALQQELWLARLPGLEKDVDPGKFWKLMRSMMPPGVRSWELAPAVSRLRSRGWPMRLLDYGLKGQKEKTEVVSVKKKKIRPTLMRPPKGYRATGLLKALQ